MFVQTRKGRRCNQNCAFQECSAPSRGHHQECHSSRTGEKRTYPPYPLWLLPPCVEVDAQPTRPTQTGERAARGRLVVRAVKSEPALHPLSDRPLLAVVINPRSIDDLETLQEQIIKMSAELRVEATAWAPPTCWPATSPWCWMTQLTPPGSGCPDATARWTSAGCSLTTAPGSRCSSPGSPSSWATLSNCVVGSAR